MKDKFNLIAYVCEEKGIIITNSDNDLLFTSSRAPSCSFPFTTSHRHIKICCCIWSSSTTLEATTLYILMKLHRTNERENLKNRYIFRYAKLAWNHTRTRFVESLEFFEKLKDFSLPHNELLNFFWNMHDIKLKRRSMKSIADEREIYWGSNKI
jgi:hypothetical protein